MCHPMILLLAGIIHLGDLGGLTRVVSLAGKLYSQGFSGSLPNTTSILAGD